MKSKDTNVQVWITKLTAQIAKLELSEYEIKRLNQ